MGGVWHLQQSQSGYKHFQFGISSDKLVPADYDGDGKTDFAIWRETPNTGAIFYIFESSSNTIRAEWFGQTDDIPTTVGDWDGDGKADVAIYRNSVVGNQAYFYYRGSANNPNSAMTSIAWGVSGDIPQRGDFDGDGKLDAAVFRPSNKSWYIRQSSNNQSTHRKWGLATDKFVPSDYDGDGKTDMAVFRDGYWYLKQTTDGDKVVQFGMALDKPVATDYDGDGKSDLAVYRDGTWYLRQSRDGFVGIGFGMPNDKPIPNAIICKNQDLIVQKEVFSQDLTDTSCTMVKSN